MKKIVYWGPATAVSAWLLIAPACRQQPQTRQYEEKDIPAAAEPIRSQGRSSSESWRWEKPPQWREEVGAGLRLATFSITSRDGSGECTLIALSSDGGGVKANVQRWLEQLHLPLFTQPELADFLTRQKKLLTGSGLPVTVIDFTTLSHSQNRLGPSLLVAIVPGENQTLFVKMSGGKALLSENREAFFMFCQSLSRGA